MFRRLHVRVGKDIKKTSKVRPTSIPKSMNKLYKFHARKRDTQNMENHQNNDQKTKWKIRKIGNECEKERKKERLTSQARGTRWAEGDTIRSKIENKLTEEKLRDRESAAYPNTPRAPSGPERIYWARAPPPPGFLGKATRGSGTGALHGRYWHLGAPEAYIFLEQTNSILKRKNHFLEGNN